MVGHRFLFFVLRYAAMSLVLGLCAGCQDVAVDNQETLAVSVRDGETGVPLVGVELCQFDTQNCTETDGDGLATLELPSGEDLAWSLVKEGYGSVLVPDRIEQTLQSSRTMWTDEWLVEQSLELGSQWPLGGDGTIWIFTTPEKGGVTFQLPEATTPPYYSWYDAETGWHSSYELTETTEDGVGGFVGVPPDDYRLRMGGTAQRCLPGLAWPGSEPNEVRAPVRPDYITYTYLNCFEF
jgi:hypothetical protein